MRQEMLKFSARIAIVLVFFSATFAEAQIDRGTITGGVTDSSGSAIPGAHVTITETSKGLSVALVTDSAGQFVASLLQIGTYTVTAEKDGFAKAVQTGISLEVNQVVHVDLALKVGAVTETVVVSAAAPLISTETSSLGTIETSQRITDLPLNGRNFVQLAYLGPGANVGAAGTGALRGTTDNARPGISLAVNGLQVFDNNFVLDGVDNNEWGQGTLVIQPAPDAIQEFRVDENSMKAQFGRGGAAVSLVLKSGSNVFHGDAYEFLRNDHLDARNFFASGKPAFQLNQFGGSLGGPIKKDKTFFFLDYEGSRSHEGLTYVSTVPTVPMRSGDFSAGGLPVYDPYTTNPTTFARQLINPGNPDVIPSNRIDAVGQALVDIYPVPNLPGEFNNFIYQPTQVSDVNQYDIRIDHRLSDKDQLFAHDSFQDVKVLRPAPLGSAGGCCQGYGSTIPTRSQSYAAGWTHTIGPTLVNDLRGAFVRWSDSAEHFDNGTNRSTQLGIPNADRGGPSSGLSLVFPSGGFSAFGDSQFVPEIATDNTFQVADTVSWVRGSHSIEFGGDVRRLQRNFYQAQAPFGLFAFAGLFTENLTTGQGGSAIADMLLGLPITSLQDGLALEDATRMWELAGFVQDDWRATPNLTLNLGLRYDVISPVGGRVGNFDLQKAIVVDNFGANAVPNAGVAYDKSDWGPRIGLAWSPFKNKSTVLRSAFGIFYSPEGNIFNDLGENPPILEFYQNTLSPLNIPTPANLLEAGFPAQLPPISPTDPTGQVKTTGPVRRIPRIIEWNFDVQHEFAKNWLLDVAYVGSHAYNLWANEVDNLDQPTQPLDSNFGPAPNYGRPYFNALPGLNTIYPIDYPSFNASFNGLEVKLDKKFSNGLNFLISYTFSKDLGSAEGDPGGGTGAIQNPYNLREEKGYVDPGFTHYFVASYLYQLPVGRGRRFGRSMGRVANAFMGGWELSGITTIRSGERFTPCISFDPTNTGTYCEWPDRVANPYNFSFNTAGQTALGSPGGRQTLQCWYNPAAFVIPALAPGQQFAHRFG